MITREANIVVCGSPVDEGALAQIKQCARVCELTRLMADHHKGYGVPIGGVLADPENLAPSAVGFDIACGMKAVLTDATLPQIQSDIRTLMDDLVGRISFGIGQKNNSTVEHGLFDSAAWRIEPVRPHKEMARRQLGTVGGGNHWVNIFADELDRVWAGCHFGSRGIGHKTASWFFSKLDLPDSMDAPVAVIGAGTPLGETYLEALELAGQYAYAGRDWVCGQVVEILGAKVLDEVHSHHNFLWREEHAGSQYWVGRKGATPCFPGQRGLVGATMAEPSMIVRGIDSPLSQELLYSTVRGAGRVMSRTKAIGKTDRRTGEVLEPGQVSPDMMADWVAQAGVELWGGGVDESPHVYKRLEEVVAHHEGTIEIEHRLRPVGVAMAGRDVRDPFKD